MKSQVESGSGHVQGCPLEYEYNVFCSNTIQYGKVANYE